MNSLKTPTASGSLDRHVRHILENAKDYSKIADVLRQDCHGHTDRLPTEVHEAAVKLDDAFKAMTEVLRELLETSAVVSLSEAKDQIEITLPSWNHDAAWEALDIVVPNVPDDLLPLAFGTKGCSAADVPKVPKAWELGQSAR